MSGPMMFQWNGEVMRPLAYFRKQAAERFKSGETYKLVEVEERSMNSHRHFFACINEAWSNLREDRAEQFPSPEHLRKWALTFTEHCDVHHYRAASNSEALRIGKFLSEGELYSRVEIMGKQVRQYVPHSQALQAMPKNSTFQKSKSAVLDVLASKLGISVEELEEAGRRAA